MQIVTIKVEAIEQYLSLFLFFLDLLQNKIWYFSFHRFRLLFIKRRGGVKMLDIFGLQALVVYKIRGAGGGLLAISHVRNKSVLYRGLPFDGLEIAIPCCFVLWKSEIT